MDFPGEIAEEGRLSDYPHSSKNDRVKPMQGLATGQTLSLSDKIG